MIQNHCRVPPQIIQTHKPSNIKHTRALTCGTTINLALIHAFRGTRSDYSPLRSGLSDKETGMNYEKS